MNQEPLAPEPTEGRYGPSARFAGSDQPASRPHPGSASDLDSPPDHGEHSYRGSGKLTDAVTLITGLLGLLGLLA